MRMIRRGAITSAVAVMAALAFPTSALALGEIAPAGCIDDNDTGPDACAPAVNGMDRAASVAVSPDGISVYVASLFDDAIVRFNRNTTTGALTSAGCIDDNDSGADTCATSINGLNGASAVAVSADGISVYVTSLNDNTIVRFNRNTTSGALTPAGCIEDNPDGPDTCASAVPGMDTPVGVAVSRDNRSVYVVSSVSDAIVRFSRNTTTGALTAGGCVDDNDTPPFSCAQTTNGLRGANSVAVSNDGASVYVTASGIGSPSEDALVRFNRNTTTGALTPVSCVDDNDTGADACTQSVNGLDGAQSVAVSRDGRSVYVASQDDDAVVRFNRATDGALTSAGCVDDNDTGTDTCGQTTNGLNGAETVAVSSDGASVYVAGQDDDAVARFNRNTTSGALTVAGCIDDNDSGTDACAPATNGLDGPDSVAVSADGLSVYAIGQFDSAIVRFNRNNT